MLVRLSLLAPVKLAERELPELLFIFFGDCGDADFLRRDVVRRGLPSALGCRRTGDSAVGLPSDDLPCDRVNGTGAGGVVLLLLISLRNENVAKK